SLRFSRRVYDIEQQVSSFFILALSFVDLREPKMGCFRRYSGTVLFRQVGIKLCCFVELAITLFCLSEGELRKRSDFRDAAFREFLQFADSLRPVEKQPVRGNEVTRLGFV